jgi:hypothetical protein
MFGKTLAKTGLVAAAVGIPYVAFNDGVRNTVSQQWKSLAGTDRPAQTVSVEDEILKDARLRAAAANSENPPDQTTWNEPTLTGPPADNFLSVIRFDVPPEWVTSRWSQVLAIEAESQLQGLRVPLVTGHELDDLAGSLTYYFDKQRRVQRLAFDGKTGDPRKLIDSVTQFYGFQEERTLAAGLYLVKWNGKPTSVLQIRYASVVRADEPNARYDVRLEINRPAAEYGLSPEAIAMLREDQHTKRW